MITTVSTWRNLSIFGKRNCTDNTFFGNFVFVQDDSVDWRLEWGDKVLGAATISATLDEKFKRAFFDSWGPRLHVD